MRYDLIKVDLLIQLVKVIHEYKGNNQSAVCQQYSQLGFDAAEAAYKILSTQENPNG